nr:PilX N-terminal domain-containing pilus assembly protein [Janthinobacterium sp. Marseille]
MKAYPHRCSRLQVGATLFTTLIMLQLVLLLGVATAQIALQGEKTARNDRDRLIAFQAAEAALLDAELDIRHSPDISESRSYIFSAESSPGFPETGDSSCGSGIQNVYLGLCRAIADGRTPTWKTLDFTDDAPLTVHTVAYGRFTGNAFPFGAGSLPARAPRYAIELLDDKSISQFSGKPAYFYRVTAIGFGVRETTQVVLQTVYRKSLPAGASGIQAPLRAGRLSWREMINWPELSLVDRKCQERRCE